MRAIFLCALALVCLAACAQVAAWAQTNRFPPINLYTGNPAGTPCTVPNNIVQSSTTGGIYACVGGVYVATGGGVTPAGANGEVQINNGSTLGAATGVTYNGNNGLNAGGTTPPTGAPPGTITGNLFYAPSQALNLLAFGGKGDERDLYDCTVTAGSTTLTCPDGAFTPADNNRTFLVRMGAQGVVIATTTATTGETVTNGLCADSTNGACNNCNVSISGGTTNATGKAYVTKALGYVPSGQTIILSNIGAGFTTAPTSAALSNGTATCSGTLPISATLGLAPVITTATRTSATTVTMATPATSTLSGTAFVSIGTDNSTPLQNWINACEALASSVACYAPQGQYAYTTAPVIASAITLYGDGVMANLGSTGWGTGGSTWILPAVPPFLQGTVLIPFTAGSNGVNIAGNSQALNLRDFGIRFAPAIAFWTTGHGINFNGPPNTHGPNYFHVSRVSVWGHDGNHYAYNLNTTGTGQMDLLAAWGGGGVNCNACANILANSMLNETTAGGTAHTFTISNGANLNQWNRLQTQQYPYSALYGIPAGLVNFYIPPLATNQMSMYIVDTSVIDQNIFAFDAEGGNGITSVYFPPSSGSYNLVGNGEGSTYDVLQGTLLNWSTYTGGKASSNALCYTVSSNGTQQIQTCSIPPLDLTAGTTKTDTSGYLGVYTYGTTATAMPGNIATSYVTKDFGPGYFPGNFTLNFQFQVTTGSSGTTSAALAGLSTANNANVAAAGNSAYASVNVTSSTAANLYVNEFYGGTGYFANAGAITVGTMYYATLSRTGTTLNLTWWTNPSRTGASVSTNLTLHAVAAYEYLYLISSQNNAFTPTASYLTSNFVVVAP